MSALELLETIEARGGVAMVKHEDGAAKINVAPRSLALELLPDLQRFKPSLIELLETECHEREAAFRTWHWKACGAPFSHGFYMDFAQFARIHVAPFGAAVPSRKSHITAPALATVALAIVGARRGGGATGEGKAGFDFSRLRVPWRVAEHLAGRSLDSPSVARWALEVLEGQSQ